MMNYATSPALKYIIVEMVTGIGFHTCVTAAVRGLSMNMCDFLSPSQEIRKQYVLYLSKCYEST